MGGSSKKVTVGYKYYIGMHMVLCHGPVDKITHIQVDGREAWAGSVTDGPIQINKPNLFGGESREGGIQGRVDFETGGPGQTPNGYLKDRLGALTPAFRGVAGVVLRQVYIGLNPYLKKWAFRVQRIHTRQNGVLQWQNSLAAVGTRVFGQRTRLHFALDVSGSMSGTRLATMKQAMSDVFDIILPFATGDAELDIKVTAWAASASTITRFNCTAQDVEDIRAWVNGRGATGGTNFDLAITQSLNYFDSSSPRNNLLFFVTDGLPSGSSADVAVSLAADMLSLNTGSFNVAAGTAVYMYGINIELADTSQTARLDNTPEDGVPVVSGSDSSGLTNAVLNGLFGAGNFSDMNPAHIIRECLTDPDWGMGYLESDVDEQSFYNAAVKLKAEGFGLSLLWDRQVPLEDFIKEVLKHVDGVLYVDRKTGLFTLKLIRADFTPSQLLHLNEDNIDRIDNFSRPAFGELTNSVSVNYWNLETGNDASVTIQDIALAQMQQAVINTTIQYPGCTSPILAARMAQRDLRTLSTPRASCTIYANRDAKDLNIGSVFRLSWEDYSVSEMVMRVTGIAYGDGRNNRIRIQCTQDTFDMPETAYVTPPESEWEDPRVEPIPVVHQAAFEVPYLELVQQLGQASVDNLLAGSPETGFVGAAAARSQVAAINARLYTNAGAGFEDVSVLDFCPVAISVSAVTRMQTVIAYTGGQDLDLVTLGTWAQIGDELVVIEGITPTDIVVKRGALDTVPLAHAAATPILFWDAYSQGDETEYVQGDIVDVRVAPVTGAGELELSLASNMVVELRGRPFRPYPPAQVRINGDFYPQDSKASISVTWVHRNRIQQTGQIILGFLDGNVTPEDGTTYTVQMRDPITDLVIWEQTGITGTSASIGPGDLPPESDFIWLHLFTVRNGIESYYHHRIRVNLFKNMGDNIIFEMDETVVPQQGDNILLELL